MKTKLKNNSSKNIRVGGVRGFFSLLGDEYKTSLMAGLITGIFAAIVALIGVLVIKNDSFSEDTYLKMMMQNPAALKFLKHLDPNISQSSTQEIITLLNQGFSNWKDTSLPNNIFGITFNLWQTNQMWRHLGQSLVQVTMIMTIARIFQVLRDKSTLDKNRVAFLTNNKNAVTLAKMISDVTIFLLPIVFVIAIALPMLNSKGAPVDIELIGKVIAYACAITILYTISSIGLKWINTFTISKVKKFIVFGIWALSSLGLAIIGGMVIGVLNGANRDLNLGDHIHDAQIYLAVIPVVNFITPLLTAYGMIDIWTISPMIGMSLIVLISIWKPFSKLQKTHLTT